VQHLHHRDARAQGAATHYVNQMNAAASNSALTTMDEPTEARKRISCLLIADAAVNSLSKADERPPNADAKSGEPQDGKQEKDVVLAHDDAAVFGDRLTPCGPSPLQHV